MASIQQAYLAVVSGKAGGHGAPLTIDGEATRSATPSHDGDDDATNGGW
jgi:hypothetical protein